jgi:hypothetical protein
MIWRSTFYYRQDWRREMRMKVEARSIPDVKLVIPRSVHLPAYSNCARGRGD